MLVALAWILVVVIVADARVVVALVVLVVIVVQHPLSCKTQESVVTCELYSSLTWKPQSHGHHHRKRAIERMQQVSTITKERVGRISPWATERP